MHLVERRSPGSITISGDKIYGFHSTFFIDDMASHFPTQSCNQLVHDSWNNLIRIDVFLTDVLAKLGWWGHTDCYAPQSNPVGRFYDFLVTVLHVKNLFPILIEWVFHIT